MRDLVLCLSFTLYNIATKLWNLKGPISLAASVSKESCSRSEVVSVKAKILTAFNEAFMIHFGCLVVAYELTFELEKRTTVENVGIEVLVQWFLYHAV